MGTLNIRAATCMFVCQFFYFKLSHLKKNSFPTFFMGYVMNTLRENELRHQQVNINRIRYVLPACNKTFKHLSCWIYFRWDKI